MESGRGGRVSRKDKGCLVRALKERKRKTDVEVSRNAPFSCVARHSAFVGREWGCCSWSDGLRSAVEKGQGRMKLVHSKRPVYVYASKMTKPFLPPLSDHRADKRGHPISRHHRSFPRLSTSYPRLARTRTQFKVYLLERNQWPTVCVCL